MTLQEIRDAIAADAGLLAAVKGENPNWAAIAEAVSVGRKRLVTRLITERGVMSVLGVVEGDAFLSGLEAFANATLPTGHPLKPAHPGIKRAIGWLKTDGIDIGDAITHQLLDALVAVGIVKAESVAKIKALAQVADAVGEYDVRRAVFNDDGSYAV